MGFAVDGGSAGRQQPGEGPVQRRRRQRPQSEIIDPHRIYTSSVSMDQKTRDRCGQTPGLVSFFVQTCWFGYQQNWFQSKLVQYLVLLVIKITFFLVFKL